MLLTSARGHHVHTYICVADNVKAHSIHAPWIRNIDNNSPNATICWTSSYHRKRNTYAKIDMVHFLLLSAVYIVDLLKWICFGSSLVFDCTLVVSISSTNNISTYSTFNQSTVFYVHLNSISIKPDINCYQMVCKHSHLIMCDMHITYTEQSSMFREWFDRSKEIEWQFKKRS